jgi:hypothetical protein
MSKFTEKTINYVNSIESADARFDLTNLLERAANRYAKKNGFGRATRIDIRLDSKNKMNECRSFGWVKDSTGEYVPMAYVNKCFGKGVSYVSAIFDCQIGVRDLWLRA